MPNTEQYAHVLLFACPNCERPLSTACAGATKNLEAAEGKWFRPHCHCGWSGDVAGVTALKHWVEPWQDKPVVPAGDPGSCDEGESQS